MAKSDKMTHQKDVTPSAPPAHPNQSSLHQQDIFVQPPGFHHGNPQQPVPINSGFQSVNVEHPTNNATNADPPQYELPETYCRKLYTNRRQTGSISGGR